MKNNCFKLKITALPKKFLLYLKKTFLHEKSLPCLKNMLLTGKSFVVEKQAGCLFHKYLSVTFKHPF
jgi:hypothetical protein